MSVASWAVSHQAVHPLLGAAQPNRKREDGIFMDDSSTSKRFDRKGAFSPANPNITALGHLVGLALQAVGYAGARNLLF